MVKGDLMSHAVLKAELQTTGLISDGFDRSFSEPIALRFAHVRFFRDCCGAVIMISFTFKFGLDTCELNGLSKHFPNGWLTVASVSEMCEPNI